jgi:hypothetical protein
MTKRKVQHFIIAYQNDLGRAMQQRQIFQSHQSDSIEAAPGLAIALLHEQSHPPVAEARPQDQAVDKATPIDQCLTELVQPPEETTSQRIGIFLDQSGYGEGRGIALCTKQSPQYDDLVAGRRL